MDEACDFRSRSLVLKTVSRMPRTFINQLYAVDMAVAAWVSIGSLSYAGCAFYLSRHIDEATRSKDLEKQVSEVAWTFEIQTAAFGAVLLLNVLNLGMRQHLLPFKCNLLLLFINSVAFATDLMLWRDMTPIIESSWGRALAPLRYVQWCHSTPTMIYMLALMADYRGWQLIVPLLSDVLMVVTGLAACYTTGLARDAFTVASFMTFALVVFYICRMFQQTLASDVSPEQRYTLRMVLVLLLALWSAFPVVWLAANWRLLSPQAEAVCWGVCDYLAKVVFSSQLWQSNLTGVQVRRDRALEAWEASNRVEAVARLTALLKQRDDLLSTLSHELRTPLAGIVALTESLCKEVAAALPSSAHTLATVRATATCMLNIVTSTLDSFAPRHGRTEAAAAAAALGQPLPAAHEGSPGVGAVSGVSAQSVVDLQSLIETVTSVLRPLAQDGVAVVNDLPKHLPLVSADSTRLSQVLYNLVGNAMRFTSHGEVRITARLVIPDEPAGPGASPAPADHATPAPDDGTPTVTAAGGAANGAGGHGGTIRWRYRRPRHSLSSNASTTSSCSAQAFSPPPPGSQVEVSVEDTGVGIKQELLDELFLPYRTGPAVRTARIGSCSGTGPAGAGYGAGAAKSAIGGTGLGLYLVRLALRAQGSDITAESAPGLGSVFRFRLPVAPPHLVAQYYQQLQQEQLHAQQSQVPGLERRRRQKKDQQQQEQQRHGELRMDDTAHHPPLVDGDDPCAAGNGDGAASGPAEGRSVVEAASPAPWVASATAKVVEVDSCSRSRGSRCGAGGMGPASPMALLWQSHEPRRVPLTEPARHSKELQRLRRSLDEQRRQRQAAGAGGAAERHPAVVGGPGSSSGFNMSSTSCCGTGSSQRCEGLCIPQPQSPLALPQGSACSSYGSGHSGTVSAGAGAVTGAGGASAAAQTMLAAAPTGTTAGVLGTCPAAAAVQPRAAAGPQSFRHRNKGVLQVMSVDDDPINQLVANQMLASQSWKVVRCMNGPEALKHFRINPKPSSADDDAGSASGGNVADPKAALAAAVAAAMPLLSPDVVLPDCVLLDVMMPGMSGFEVCRLLREHFSPAQLPIIIVSAKGDAAAVEEAFESGADDYMTKPYKRTEMVARIKAQIRIRDTAAVAAAAAAAAPVETVAAAVQTADRVVACPNCAAAARAAADVSPADVVAASEPCQSEPRQVHTAPVVTQALAPSSAPVTRQRYPTGLARVLLASDRPSSMDALTLPAAAEGRDGRPASGCHEGSRLRPAGQSRYYPRSDSLHTDSGAAAAPIPQENGVPAYGVLADSVTAPAALMGGSPANAHVVQAQADASGGEGSGADASPPPSRVSVLDAGVDPGAQLPAAVAASHLLGPPPPEPPSAGAQVIPGACGVAVGCADAASAMLQEVLSEVRKARASDAELVKLNYRMASLQAACGTLAAERDGWRRQARELRALLAAGMASATGGAAATGAAAASPVLSFGPIGAAGKGGRTGVSGGGCYTAQLADMLAAAHASRSSGDSGGFVAAAMPLAAGQAGAPTPSDVPSGGGSSVAAQLEDLKREAARLRQQLSYAMASVGNGSVGNVSTNLTTGDTTGSRGLALAMAALGPRSGLETRLLRPTQEGGTATAPDAGSCQALARADGADAAAAAGSRAATWGIDMIPNPAFANGADMLLSTEASGLSAVIVGAGHRTGPDDSGASAVRNGFAVPPASTYLTASCCDPPDACTAATAAAVGPPLIVPVDKAALSSLRVSANGGDAAPAARPLVSAAAGGVTGGPAVDTAATVGNCVARLQPVVVPMASISLPCDGGGGIRGGRALAVSGAFPPPATTNPSCSSHVEEASLAALAARGSSATAGGTNNMGTLSVHGVGGASRSPQPAGPDSDPPITSTTPQPLVGTPPALQPLPSPPASGAGAAPVPAVGVSPPSASSARGATPRSRGGGSGGPSSGGGGILRLLCSKGAVPSATSPGSSPH